jgi:hypothetical protein
MLTADAITSAVRDRSEIDHAINEAMRAAVVDVLPRFIEQWQWEQGRRGLDRYVAYKEVKGSIDRYAEHLAGRIAKELQNHYIATR